MKIWVLEFYIPYEGTMQYGYWNKKPSVEHLIKADCGMTKKYAEKVIATGRAKTSSNDAWELNEIEVTEI